MGGATFGPLNKFLAGFLEFSRKNPTNPPKKPKAPAFLAMGATQTDGSWRSDSITTISVLKDIISKEATARSLGFLRIFYVLVSFFFGYVLY